MFPNNPYSNLQHFATYFILQFFTHQKWHITTCHCYDGKHGTDNNFSISQRTVIYAGNLDCVTIERHKFREQGLK